MSIRKRKWTNKSGSHVAWIVDKFDKDGHRHIKTFATEGEAKDYDAKSHIERKRGTLVAPSKSLTVEGAAKKWLEGCKANHLEASTLAQYDSHARIHIVPRLGKTKLGHLTKEHVEDLRKQLLEDLSRPLAQKVLTSFHQLLKANDYAHVGPGVTVKKSKRDKRKLEVGRDIPTNAEIKRMVDATTDTRARALLLLAAFTGLRSSELRGLRWSDVDLKSGEVHVRQRADKFYEIGLPKSEGSQRTVPIDLTTVGKALAEWKVACPLKAESGLVFPDKDGEPVHHEILLRLLRLVMDKAGIRNKYGLHSFRHYFASWCANPEAKGGRALPPLSVKALLGHSSIVMTMDIYGHIFPKGDDSAELQKSVSRVLA